LTSADFQIFEDNQPQTITSIKVKRASHSRHLQLFIGRIDDLQCEGSLSVQSCRVKGVASQNPIDLF